MLSRLRAAGLVWPTLLSIPALVLLVSLGNWQMSRKAWKEALLAQIESGLKAQPVPLDDVLRGWPCLGRAECIFPEYRRVKLRGRFEHDAERYFFAPDPRLGPGYHVFTPLQLENGRRVIVNRGFVPDSLKAPGSRTAGQLPGVVNVVGLLRAPGAKAAFTPANEPAENLWFWRDLEAMAGCTRESTDARCASFVRVFVDAEAEPANPGGWPRGGATNLDIPNRHLEYAVTWYGLALTLIGVFAAFAMPRWRKAGKSLSNTVA